MSEFRFSRDHSLSESSGKKLPRLRSCPLLAPTAVATADRARAARKRKMSGTTMLLPEEVAEAATKGELQKVVKWLRKGGHVDARGEQEGARFTLLHWAATFGHVSLAKEVLKRRADVNLLSSGCTPLMAAAFALPPEQDMAGVPASVPGRLGVLRLLLQQNAAVNFQNDSNYTALMSAAEDGNDACIAILLEAGADTSLRENEGRNALDIAKANHHDSAAQMLLQHMLLQHTAAHSPATAVENAEAATGAAAAEIAAGMGVAEPQPNETPAQPTPPALELERVLEVTRAMNLTDAETASLSEAMEAPGEGPSASDARAKLNHVDMQKPEARGSCGAGSSGAMSVEEFLKLPDFGTRSTASDGGKGLDVGGKAPRGPVTDNQAWAAMALETLPSSMLYADGDDQPMPAGKKGTKKSLTVTALELAKVLPPESLASVLQIVVELAAISQLEEYELDDWAPAVQVVPMALAWLDEALSLEVPLVTGSSRPSPRALPQRSSAGPGWSTRWEPQARHRTAGQPELWRTYCRPAPWAPEARA